MGDEYELKLELTPEQVRSLPRNPLVKSLSQGRSATQKLYSTYFDTPTRSLDAHEMALRVRRMGRRRMQTLKVRANGPSGLQHFKEFECDIAGEHPQLSNIMEKGLRALIDKEKLAESVAPVFTTDFTRRRWRLSLQETTIELALDQGEIRSGDRTLPICEAELELISGRPSRIFELALSLQESMPFRLESRTKARRGYDLAADFVPQPVYGERPALARNISLRNAILSVARTCRDHFRANEPAVLSSTDPEGIHQMRVGIRRLRALLQAVRRFLPPARYEPLARELGWLQRELGPARDWDVFIADCLEPLASLQPEDAGLARLLADAGALRATAYEGARTALRSPRYARLVLQLNLSLAQDNVPGNRPLLALPGMAKPWLDTARSGPAKEASGKRRRKRARSGDDQQPYDEAPLFMDAAPAKDVVQRQAGKAYTRVAPLKELRADSMLSRRHAADPGLDEPARTFAEQLFAERGRKLKKCARGHEQLDEAQLHKLRIEAKKLRYAIEFFGNLFEGKATGKTTKALSALQDSLGGLNDAAVGHRLLQELVHAHPDYGSAPEIAHAFGLVNGWQAHRLAEGRSKFGLCWKHYEDVALS
ncbi:MAG TPA: CYTH and CHAD domain-containing protein [Kiloniellales bacterium]|jgi:inorganic triphosphatase YgiF